jgi:MFS family permease
MECDACRAMVSQSMDPARIRRSWQAVETMIDQPHRSMIERLLVRLGVRDHDARIVAGAPALSPAWLMAVAAVLVTALVLDSASDGWGSAFYVFLIAAPLLPLVGVAAAFHPSADPARELAIAAPKPVLEVLLARAVSVLGVTVVLTAIAAVIRPDDGWSAVVWLLPALGLTTSTMALATWVPAHWGAAGLGFLWVTAATINYRGARVSHDAVTRFVAFQPSGQFGFAVLAAGAAGVLLLRRTSLEVGRIQ